MLYRASGASPQSLPRLRELKSLVHDSPAASLVDHVDKAPFRLRQIQR
jgi:hypothetical protein